LARFYNDIYTTKQGLIFILIKNDGTILKWCTTDKIVMHTHLQTFEASDFSGWKIFNTRELANKFIEGLTSTELIFRDAAQKRA
jgi:hypothetical protein